MAELYERKVVVEIQPEVGPIKIIDGLKISFDVGKSSKSSPNRGSIKIFNLSEKTRALVESKSTRVSLKIGYLGLNPQGIFNSGFLSSKTTSLVFVGNIAKFSHSKDGPEIITDIELGDGLNRYKNAPIEKSYGEGARLNIAINDLITALGLKKGSILSIPQKTYGNGLVLSGLAKTQLDKLCDANDLEWSIQDESVQIVPRYTSTNESVILLNSKTGLVGSPQKTKDGILFKSLIQPALRPGRKVKIESMFLNATYTLRTVQHSGDSHEGPFHSTCEAKK